MAESDYTLVYEITVNPDLLKRLYACSAIESELIDYDIYPETWVAERRYDYAATPGWSAAVASAVAGGNEEWGGDPAVITDAMILSRTQELLQESKPPGSPGGQSVGPQNSWGG